MSTGYAEISPSGTCVRLITTCAHVGDFKNHAEGVEIFETTGFVTITGNMLRHADIEPMSAALRAAVERHRPRRMQVQTAKRSGEPVDPEDIRDALTHISPDCGRDTWLRIAMALHSEGVDFKVFHEWSAKGEKYEGAQDCLKVWDSLGDGDVTIGTLFHYAKQAGWQRIRRDDEDGCPIIRVAGGTLAANTTGAIDALAAQDPPVIFQRGSILTRIAHLPDNE
jgi:hypothetical protein